MTETATGRPAPLWGFRLPQHAKSFLQIEVRPRLLMITRLASRRRDRGHWMIRWIGVAWIRLMKLRLQGNSVRLRLTRSEVERLVDTGLVEESVDFGGSEVLAYRLHSRLEPGPVQAVFRQGSVTVSVSTEDAQAWADTDEVGIYIQSGGLAISI